MKPKYLKLLDIEVPVDVYDFITPDMEAVLAFYPEWRRRGGEWSIQGYFSGFCTALEKYERLEGLPEKDRMARAVEHFGPSGIGAMLEKYGAEVVAA